MDIIDLRQLFYEVFIICHNDNARRNPNFLCFTHSSEILYGFCDSNFMIALFMFYVREIMNLLRDRVFCRMEVDINDYNEVAFRLN